MNQLSSNKSKLFVWKLYIKFIIDFICILLYLGTTQDVGLQDVGLQSTKRITYFSPSLPVAPSFQPNASSSFPTKASSSSSSSSSSSDVFNVPPTLANHYEHETLMHNENNSSKLSIYLRCFCIYSIHFLSTVVHI